MHYTKWKETRDLLLHLKEVLGSQDSGKGKGERAGLASLAHGKIPRVVEMTERTRELQREWSLLNAERV